MNPNKKLSRLSAITAVVRNLTEERRRSISDIKKEDVGNDKIKLPYGILLKESKKMNYVCYQ